MGVAMRGDDGICGSFCSYIDLEERVRADHPLRVIRQIANAALKSLSGEFAKLYSPIGRESIPPERLMPPSVPVRTWAASDGAALPQATQES
jgi:hypothetical protein